MPETEAALTVERLVRARVHTLVDAHGPIADLRYRHRPHHPHVRGADLLKVSGQGPPHRHPVPGGAAGQVVQAVLHGRPADVGTDVADRLASLGQQQTAQVQLPLRRWSRRGNEANSASVPASPAPVPGPDHRPDRTARTLPGSRQSERSQWSLPFAAPLARLTSPNCADEVGGAPDTHPGRGARPPPGLGDERHGGRGHGRATGEVTGPHSPPGSGCLVPSSP